MQLICKSRHWRGSGPKASLVAPGCFARWFDLDRTYQDKVDRLWSAAREAARENATKNATSLFDGPLLRLDALMGNRLIVSPTRYRHFHAARQLNAEQGAMVGTRPWSRRVTPVGAQTFLFTRDGELLLFRRSMTMAVGPGLLRGLGGTSDPDLDVIHDRLDLGRTAQREVAEELGCPLAEVGLTDRSFRYAGLMFNPDFWMVTALFWARTNISAHQALDLPLDAEHEGLVVVRQSRQGRLLAKLARNDPGLGRFLSPIFHAQGWGSRLD